MTLNDRTNSVLLDKADSRKLLSPLEKRYLNAKRALFQKAYSNLNSRQQEAVFTVNGPLLVLAGAGSGKTTVLVRRIAFLIRYGNAYYSQYIPYGMDEATVQSLESAAELSAKELDLHFLSAFAANACEPWRVLAITFTNKAANEIRERLRTMFPEDESIANEIWTGTFHSVCMRILRKHGAKVGYAQGFTIYDEQDSKKALLTVMERLGIDEKMLSVKTVQAAISRAKDRLISPDDFSEEAGQDYRQKQIARIYEAYQMVLRESNALDFDDIIMQTVLLLERHADVLEEYQKRFRYVCVDEFQDTNLAQLKLTTLLSGHYRNLMVVGDDDQSIYKFRGATVDNILSFDRIFENTKMIKLEQNYRSTQTILEAANDVISHNKGRKGKTLWTSGEVGEPILLITCEDQNAEGRQIAERIQKTVAEQKANYRDFAILYRTNAQSRSIETALKYSAVPYRVMGGTRFSDRKEIRDIVAYLQLVNNHADNVRLARIINEPKRKIGAKTMDAIAQIALELNCSQFEVIANADRYTALDRSRSTLLEFSGVIRQLSLLSETLGLDELFDRVMDMTGYRKMLEEGGPEEIERLENLKEFKSGILEYMDSHEHPTLTEFLEETALVADIDNYDESADAVVMMTVHSAKGLEFPIVFLPGMEDGLFPGMKTMIEGDAEMEEERRLAYVAITRAKRQLILLHTKTRLLYSQTMYNPVSRFVLEIPDRLVERQDLCAKFGASDPAGKKGPYGTRGEGTIAVPQMRTYYSEKGARTGSDRNSFGGFSPASGGNGFGMPFSLRAKKAASEQYPILCEGDRVRHANFGEGEILSVKPMGADYLYEIVFDRVGTKKLMATYAKLTKI